MSQARLLSYRRRSNRRANAMLLGLLAALVIAAASLEVATAAETHVVAAANISDDKAVFATVEAPKPVPARVRTGGTVAQLTVKEGDQVTAGQIIATVGDEKLALQMKSLDAQIAGLEAQLAQAKTDLARAENLAERGTIPKVRLDEARTAAEVAGTALRAQRRKIGHRAATDGRPGSGADGGPRADRALHDWRRRSPR